MTIDLEPVLQKLRTAFANIAAMRGSQVRYELATPMEIWKLRILNSAENNVMFRGERVTGFQPSPRLDDIEKKQDCYGFTPTKRLTEQGKFRVSGAGFLFCVVQPKLGSPVYGMDVCDPDRVRAALDIHGPENVLGRDMRGEVDLYSCFPNTLEALFALEYDQVSPLLNGLLRSWLQSGKIIKPKHPYTDDKYPGFELRYKLDEDSGTPKILAFLDDPKKAGLVCQRFELTEPPQEVLDLVAEHEAKQNTMAASWAKFKR